MLFQFNIYSSLLIPPFLQGLLFGMLLLAGTQKRNGTANGILGIILILLCIKVAYWMLGFAGWYDSHNWLTSLMFYFPFNVTLLIGPLLYFYFLAITNEDFKFSKKQIAHLWLPIGWLIVMIGKLIIDFAGYYPFLQTPAYQFGTRGPWAELDKTMMFNVISYLSFVYYLWLTLAAYGNYRKYADQHFSTLENIDFRWIRRVIYAIAASIGILFIYQFVSWISPLSYKTDWYSYLFLGILIYYISIKGYQIQMVSRPALHFEQEVFISAEIGATDQAKLPDLKVWVHKLRVLMAQEKPFLQCDITSGQLAKMIGTNTSILSKVINDGFGLNFNDFINGYRTQEVIKRLTAKDQLNITLLGIALESGFNSKATFNRAFKKQTGKTPKQYIAHKE